MFLTRLGLKGPDNLKKVVVFGVLVLFTKMSGCTNVCFEFLVLTQEPTETLFELTTSPLETVSLEATHVRSH